MTAMEAEVARLADAIEAYNGRERSAEVEADLRALRDLPRIATAVKRGLMLTMVKQGMWQTVVPASYWTEDGIAEQIVVSCVCGEEARLDGMLIPAACECGRWFMYDGRHVRAAVRPTRHERDMA